MIVEFAGCTSAGKTVIASGVADVLKSQGLRVTDQTGGSSSIAVSARNAIVTPFLLLFLLARRDSHLTYLTNAARAIRRRGLSRFWTAARIAAAIRIIGQHARRLSYSKSLYIVDEGVLTTLALTSDAEGIRDLQLPDIVVIVDAPIETLVRRVLARSDAPREVRRLDSQSLAARLTAIQHAYNGAMRDPRLSQRSIRIFNPDGPQAELEERIHAAAESVMESLAQWRN